MLPIFSVPYLIWRLARTNVLLDKQIISAPTFTALLLMAVASTPLTVPMVTPLLARTKGGVGRSG